MNLGAQPVQPYHDFTHLDSRGTGGKTMIMHHMKNHYNGLIDTKPQLKITAPKKYIYENKHKHKQKVLLDPAAEVKVAFRKVATMNKGYIDTKAPATLNMTKNLAGRFEKAKKHETYEHQLNINSMKKKLSTKKKLMKDRLKDPQDPIAHPVRFFRKNAELPKKMIDYLYEVPAGSRIILTNDDAKLKMKLDKAAEKKSSIVDFNYELTKGNNTVVRPKTVDLKATQNQTKKETSIQSAKGRIVLIAGPQPGVRPFVIDEKLDCPEAKLNPNGCEILKKKLLDIIVKYSFYKDSQLQILFHDFRNANKNLDQLTVEKAIQSVLQVMNE